MAEETTSSDQDEPRDGPDLGLTPEQELLAKNNFEAMDKAFESGGEEALDEQIRKMLSPRG